MNKVFVNRVDEIVKNTHVCVCMRLHKEKGSSSSYSFQRNAQLPKQSIERENSENQCNGMENAPIIIYFFHFDADGYHLSSPS